MKQSLSFIFFGLFTTFLFLGCQDDDLLLSAEEGEEFSGGETTVFSSAGIAFGFQASNIRGQDELDFFVGNSLFNQAWVTAPASTTARDGLGPLFNARSCSACHFRDGRGRPPEFNGETNHGLLLRISTDNSITNGPVAHPVYGAQIQDQAILGLAREAGFSIEYDIISGTYSDGSSYELQSPNYIINNLTQGPLINIEVSPRVANHMVGLGLLEAISEATLIELSDPDDNDNDGISGRINYVPNKLSNTLEPGRFGWKANEPTVLQQTAAAFAGDLGITSDLFPDENCPPESDCSQFPNGGAPEIPMENLERVSLYASTLAVPGRRDWEKQNVLRGKKLFKRLNCNGCHISNITTGVHPRFEPLSFQNIRPYTDLLLHDMGEGLADNRPEYLANGREWRTPPLWGIGLFEIVNGHTYYLHDGRARNLEEAILWHGGEAENSREAFIELGKAERDDLISFLKSL